MGRVTVGWAVAPLWWGGLGRQEPVRYSRAGVGEG
jgi:hypothetical protein